jgi:hypothetical protein
LVDIPVINGLISHRSLASWPETPLLTAKWARAEGVGAFSVMLISYPHLYPHFVVAGIMFIDKRVIAPAMNSEKQERAMSGE